MAFYLGNTPISAEETKHARRDTILEEAEENEDTDIFKAPPSAPAAAAPRAGAPGLGQRLSEVDRAFYLGNTIPMGNTSSMLTAPPLEPDEPALQEDDKAPVSTETSSHSTGLMGGLKRGSLVLAKALKPPSLGGHRSFGLQDTC